MPTLRTLVPCLLILAISVVPGNANGNGGKGKKTLYKGEVELGEAGSIAFSSELESILFQLNSVRNKYKVVRLKIVNDSRRVLRLSPDQDKVELVFASGPAVPGILNLAARDAALWDSLSAELRRALVYPQMVEAGEEENVFVFIADPALARLPRLFRYRIASLADPVEIVDATPVAAH